MNIFKIQGIFLMILALLTAMPMEAHAYYKRKSNNGGPKTELPLNYHQEAMDATRELLKHETEALEEGRFDAETFNSILSEATARPHPDKVICKSEPWVLTTEAYRLLYQTFTPYLREAERKLLGKKPLKRLGPPGKGDKRSLTLYEWYTYHPLPSAPSAPEDSMRIPNPYSPEPYVIYEK